jgi:hypothetical protein
LVQQLLVCDARVRQDELVPALSSLRKAATQHNCLLDLPRIVPPAFYFLLCCHYRQVRNQESGVPQLVAVSSAVGFGSLDLSIHSYSADWLYQALLYIFSGVIQRQIEEAVNNAMHTVRTAQRSRHSKA